MVRVTPGSSRAPTTPGVRELASRLRVRSAWVDHRARSAEPAGRLPVGGSLTDSTAPSIDSLAEFERVLGLGLGRAILFLRQNDARPYRDVILNACTHWTGYDQQVEGTRTPYLMTVLDATGDLASYVEPILAAFRASTDRRDQQQLIRLASEVAQDGYAEARAALYECFDRNDTEEPFACASELIGVDGLDGLLYIAERIGAALLENPAALGDDDWLLRSLRDDAGERCGKEAVQATLAQAARESPHVRAYVQRVQAIDAEEAAQRAARSAARVARPRGRSGQGDLRNTPYEHIKRQIAEASPPWSMRGLLSWGERASADDLAHAAADLLAERDERRLRAYLEVFRRRPFPLEVDRLLALMRHPDDRIMVSAANALSRVAHPRVRALALEICADSSLEGWRKSWGVRLLRSNFEPGDVPLLIQLLDTSSDEMGYHSIGFAIVDVLGANPVPEVVPVLRLLYERGPCTNCRKQAVELLRQLGALPDWLLEECRYDASEYLRDAADAWARGEEPANT